MTKLHSSNGHKTYGLVTLTSDLFISCKAHDMGNPRVNLWLSRAFHSNVKGKLGKLQTGLF